MLYYVNIDSVINGLKAQKHSAQSNALGKRVIGSALRRSMKIQNRSAKFVGVWIVLKP